MVDLIPFSNWGRDHWSTLAFIETVMVEKGSFPIMGDARMRSNRRNFRVMPAANAMCMDLESGSLLADGTTVKGHDDWCCIQDFAAEGLLDKAQEEIDIGETIKFSDLGISIAHKLREHKIKGGSFGTFKP